MTEEIIIDGIDVSGCNFRLERDNKQKCECCHATGFGVICDCEAWHNCYYKQLKRLEQENKELKAYKDVNEDFKKAWDELNRKYTEVLELAKTNTDSNEYCLQELEKENKKLKEENITAQKEYWKLEQGNDFLAEKVRLYRSALEEIREYLNTLLSVDSDFPNTETYLRIQGKISEVLND